jgi:hypothetical protein
MFIPNGDAWAAAFLASEPQYTQASWTDAYAKCIGICRPEIGVVAATDLAREAFALEGSWNNPKVAAGCDAVFGTLKAR